MILHLFQILKLNFNKMILLLVIVNHYCILFLSFYFLCLQFVYKIVCVSIDVYDFFHCRPFFVRCFFLTSLCSQVQSNMFGYNYSNCICICAKIVFFFLVLFICITRVIDHEIYVCLLFLFCYELSKKNFI